MTTTKQRAWSKRRWLAEHLGCDLKEVEHYQRPQDNEGVQLFQSGGEVFAVAVTEGERKKAVVAMGAAFTAKTHWKDANVSVFMRGNVQCSDSAAKAVAQGTKRAHAGTKAEYVVSAPELAPPPPGWSVATPETLPEAWSAYTGQGFKTDDELLQAARLRNWTCAKRELQDLHARQANAFSQGAAPPGTVVRLKARRDMTGDEVLAWEAAWRKGEAEKWLGITQREKLAGSPRMTSMKHEEPSEQLCAVMMAHARANNPGVFVLLLPVKVVYVEVQS